MNKDDRLRSKGDKMKECVNTKCKYNNGNLKNGCQYLNDITKCKKVNIIENEIQDNLSSSSPSGIISQPNERLECPNCSEILKYWDGHNSNPENCDDPQYGCKCGFKIYIENPTRK